MEYLAARPAANCAMIVAVGADHVRPVEQFVGQLARNGRIKFNATDVRRYLNGTDIFVTSYENISAIHLCPLQANGWESTTFADRFRSLVEGFAVFNPHATITLDWFGEHTAWTATDAEWSKWKPNKPTSSHWYELAHFERLIGAYITHDRDAGADRLVSDLVAEFDGLTGSQKRSKVLVDAGLKRVNLADFVLGDRLDSQRIERLLKSMQQHTRPIKARRLGLIGEPHLRQRLLAMGVQPESFSYSKKLSEDGVPGVLESAFGWLGDESEDARRIFAGANWSAAIKNPYRSFGQTGEGLEAVLAQQRAGRNEPVVFCLHLAQPRVEYTDRGKSALVIGGTA